MAAQFFPTPVGINGQERRRVTLGVALGVLLAGLLSRWYAQAGSLQPWMLPSLGASAVLVFGMPSSPLSQPWPVLAGNTVSMLVGLVCAALVPHPAWAAALAVALAVAVAVAVVLKDAWALMRREQIKALHLVDALHSVADFMRLAHLEVHEGLGKRLRTLVMGRGEQSKAVGEIMSPQVQVAQDVQHVMDLVPLFSHGGHHHIPIMDAQQHLVGIVTQIDLVRALAVTVQVPQA